MVEFLFHGHKALCLIPSTGVKEHTYNFSMQEGEQDLALNYIVSSVAEASLGYLELIYIYLLKGKILIKEYLLPGGNGGGRGGGL